MDYLSRMIKINTHVPSFKYHPKCAKMQITHLAFADDLILFARGEAGSVRILMQTIHNFGQMSGLYINHQKSKVFAAGVSPEVLNEIQNITQFSLGDFPIRYLGVPLVHGRMKIAHFAPLIESISGHIKHWMTNSISYAGRLELISSVIQGIQAFWLHAFPLPSTIIEKANKLCRDFLWAGGKPKVAWHNICTPKKEGGLGLRDIKTWNSTILMKVLWNININKDSLWIKWVHDYYLRGWDLWEWICRIDDHPLFKKLGKIKNILLMRAGNASSAMQLLNTWFVGGVFSVHKAYDWLRSKKDNKPWMPLIWRIYIPPKYSFILWFGMRGRLYTMEKWESNIEDRRCVLCKNHLETLSHMFFQCTFVKAIWYKIRKWLGIKREMSTLSSAIKWIKKDYNGALIKSKAVVLALASTVYHIWMARNSVIFSHMHAEVDGLFISIQTALYRVFFSLYPIESIAF